MIVGVVDNRVKIKTDAGLRVINCACCTPPCEEGCAVSIPSSIRNLVQNATIGSWTLNGLSPTSFDRLSPTSWLSIIGGEGYYWDTGYTDGCLYFYLAGNPSAEDMLAETGSDEFNCGQGFSPVYGKFTINGNSEFDYFYVGSGQPFPPPVYNFT